MFMKPDQLQVFIFPRISPSILDPRKTPIHLQYPVQISLNKRLFPLSSVIFHNVPSLPPPPPPRSALRYSTKNHSSLPPKPRYPVSTHDHTPTPSLPKNLKSSGIGGFLVSIPQIPITTRAALSTGVISTVPASTSTSTPTSGCSMRRAWIG